ncbi:MULTISPECIES: hypothetical protein [unclassified Rhizobium]|uniref:hypothetical protein n=1 Tax=unclassified Rhizobium TaxID=2613769 RepID=UPI0006492194|nr:MULTISPECIES: hypothetical protein [unclassified Rhizobium]MBN8950696.1 hypothetical protein [Rhizobium tropici]OJY66232.1 MAG: hypothetical protein BGP09_30265 [Rhizobium sp. 60-20]RKD69202.1 hypothetical protein BJ928_104342 [Rhizobium sp. WW_1]
MDAFLISKKNGKILVFPLSSAVGRMGEPAGHAKVEQSYLGQGSVNFSFQEFHHLHDAILHVDRQTEEYGSADDIRGFIP